MRRGGRWRGKGLTARWGWCRGQPDHVPHACLPSHVSAIIYRPAPTRVRMPSKAALGPPLSIRRDTAGHKGNTPRRGRSNTRRMVPAQAGSTTAVRGGPSRAGEPPPRAGTDRTGRHPSRVPRAAQSRSRFVGRQTDGNLRGSHGGSYVLHPMHARALCLPRAALPTRRGCPSTSAEFSSPFPSVHHEVCAR
jgi:hypothetical protein